MGVCRGGGGNKCVVVGRVGFYCSSITKCGRECCNVIKLLFLYHAR